MRGAELYSDPLTRKRSPWHLTQAVSQAPEEFTTDTQHEVCTIGAKRRKLVPFHERQNSFFDTIPDDAMDNIVRFTSEKPRSDCWTCFVKQDVALSLLQSIPALASSARRSFKSIQQESSGMVSKPGALVVRAQRGLVYNEFLDIVGQLGEDLKEITMDWRNVPHTWTMALLTTGFNLKKLTVASGIAPMYTPLSNILTMRTSKLDTLEYFILDIESRDLAAMWAHCMGLKSLTLEFRSIKAPMEPLWKKLGWSLESLSFKSHRYPFELRSVAKYCRNLHTLSFHKISSDMQVDVAAVCCAYKERLRFLTLAHCHMAPEHLAKIASSCPNVRIDMEEAFGCCADGLHAIGERARQISIGYRTLAGCKRHHGQFSRGTSMRCTNVEVVTWRSQLPSRFFLAFFGCDKPKLKEFKCEHFAGTPAHHIFQVLKYTAPALEKLDLFGARLSKSVLTKFVEKSRNIVSLRLCNVFNEGICFCDYGRRWTQCKDMNWGTLTEVFLQLPRLRELELGCTISARRYKSPMIPEFNVACYPARKRNISINICGFQYS